MRKHDIETKKLVGGRETTNTVQGVNARDGQELFNVVQEQMTRPDVVGTDMINMKNLQGVRVVRLQKRFPSKALIMPSVAGL